MSSIGYFSYLVTVTATLMISPSIPFANQYIFCLVFRQRIQYNLSLLESQMGEEATAAVETVDHFYRLPDSIIHKILTFLPTRARDAGRTSVLSKRWNHLWSSYPYFDYFLYPSYTDFRLKQIEEKFPEVQNCMEEVLNFLKSSNCKEEFLNFLESSVEPRLQKNRFIYRFQVNIDFPDIVMLAPRIDRWVRMAVEKNVAELNLFALDYPTFARIVPNWYSVPQEVLLSETLRHLELWGCKLEGKLDIKLPRLKNLKFYEVEGLDVEMLRNFTRCCPSIKNLLLLRCNELKSTVSVAGLTHLKSATFFNCHGLRSVEIKAPSLRKFTFSVWLDDEKMPCEIKLSTCIGLKKLKLCGARMSFRSFICIISKVEVLVLKSCYSLESMELPTQNLKKLVLNNCTNLYIGEIRSPLDREIKDIPVWHPHKFHIQFPLKGHHDIFWWYNFSYFLGEKCMFNDDLKLAIYNPKFRTIILHDNLKEVSLSSLLEDENLWTCSCICISSMSYSDIVDYLLRENQLTILAVVCPHSKPIQEVILQVLYVIKLLHRSILLNTQL